MNNFIDKKYYVCIISLHSIFSRSVCLYFPNIFVSHLYTIPNSIANNFFYNSFFAYALEFWNSIACANSILPPFSVILCVFGMQWIYKLNDGNLLRTAFILYEQSHELHNNFSFINMDYVRYIEISNKTKNGIKKQQISVWFFFLHITDGRVFQWVQEEIHRTLWLWCYQVVTNNYFSCIYFLLFSINVRMIFFICSVGCNDSVHTGLRTLQRWRSTLVLTKNQNTEKKHEFLRKTFSHCNCNRTNQTSNHYF